MDELKVYFGIALGIIIVLGILMLGVTFLMGMGNVLLDRCEWNGFYDWPDYDFALQEPHILVTELNAQPEIVLIRGIPGSGKSTIAKEEYPDHVLCEANQYFTRRGRWLYNHKRVKNAHAWCQRKALSELEKGNNIVVANTFIRLWELKPYFDMGYPVKIVVAKGNYRNWHNVPEKVVERMKHNYEPSELDDVLIDS